MIMRQPSYAQKPTFYRDVQPLIHANCAVCHRPGEAAPFSLITYEDVTKRSKFIKKVVVSGYMPPWRADDHYVTFANKRSLTPEQIKTLTDWIDADMPKGKVNTEAESALLKRAQAGTGYSRVPDLTLRMLKPFTVVRDGKEHFMVFKIPFGLAETANVEAVEFTSNNKKAIHHANFAIHPVEDPAISLTNTAEQVDLNGEDASRYREWLPYKKQMTYYGGWVPGTTVETYPADMGWVMPKRGVMLLTVHFGPSAKDTISLNGVNFFFTKKPIRRTVKVISLGSGGIGERDISPPLLVFGGDSLTTKLKVAYRNQPITLLYAWPHMHQIGKRFTAFVTQADQDTIPLVRIPDWDFRWQEIYRYEKPVILPTGAVINVIGTYDNTESNPLNPNKPPKIITSDGQMRSDQEMMTLLLLYVAYEPGDENLRLN
ncbi:cytochrome c [Spirosoma sp. BT704]|uniref:Cytochrome c n=2 Tax=Spirosoma validum TaxID=2771355 RepID=A0A927AZM7_9BACT|nr:cytochrome c [Spirosoma validum]